MGCSYDRLKGVTTTNAFLKTLDYSVCKPNEIWLDKGTEFYSRSMKSQLPDSNKYNLLLLKDLLEP